MCNYTYIVFFKSFSLYFNMHLCYHLQIKIPINLSKLLRLFATIVNMLLVRLFMTIIKPKKLFKIKNILKILEYEILFFEIHVNTFIKYVTQKI